jgi:hypothetical protein
MLNLSSLFFTGDDAEQCLQASLDLHSHERDYIAAAKTAVRAALRDGIPRELRLLGYTQDIPTPRFFTQGSWAYKTLNCPAKKPQQADVDDGCYLPLSFLTQTRRPSIAATVFFTVAQKALEPLIKERGWQLVTDKPTCIRIVISTTAHIDVPLYAIPDTEFATLSARAMALDSVYANFSEAIAKAERDAWTALPSDGVLLAHREDDWMESDPRPVKQWFLRKVDEHGEQLRRVVRYLKAHRDWRWASGGPASILLMAAAVPLFEKHDRRDDLALLKVVKGLPPVLRKGVNNPVDDSESLTDRLRKASKERDLVEEAALAFERLGSLLEGALAASNAAQACEWMRQAFGPRFPNCPERVKVVSEPPAAAKSTVLGGLMAAGAALAAANPTRPVPTGSEKSNTLG